MTSAAEVSNLLQVIIWHLVSFVEVKQPYGVVSISSTLFAAEHVTDFQSTKHNKPENVNVAYQVVAKKLLREVAAQWHVIF